MKKRIKNNKNKTATFNLIEVIIIIIMTSLIVSVATGVIVYQNYYEIDSTNNKENKNYLKEIEKAYNNIINSYVETIDEEELMNSAIEAMYSYLGDPYTGYLDKDVTNDLMDRLNGEYKGIGVEISGSEEGTIIMNVFDNSPASKAGFKKGDIIVKINNTDVKSLSTKEVSNMIKNAEDKIKITVLREKENIELTVEVQEVYVPSVESKKYEDTGYLKITTFSNNTYDQFKKELKNLESKGIKNLIIDVRDNGGGYLNSAVEIAELFIEKDKVIYGLESKEGKKTYKDSTDESRNYKIGILINTSSASASEILTAALKESYGATLIGNITYGKGTVQETSMMDSGGMIKYTTAYWLTPSGNKINNIGIKPDIDVKNVYNDDMTLKEDKQLKEALNAVK